MFSRIPVIGFLILCSIPISLPAHSAAQIYSWQDASGVVTFSDDPAHAPSDARVSVFSSGDSEPQAAAGTGLTETAAAEIPERPSRIATQGEFALQLVRELGLGNLSDAAEAADMLTSVRIAPQLGRWELDQAMTPELSTRLRTLTVAAAERGWITITSDQALLAFDTAAALLDAPAPAPADPESPESPYPTLEAPPEVYLYPPPPEFYPYYIWTPVAGGFWWNDFLFPGFFALNVDLFFINHHHHPHPRSFSGGRRFTPTSFGIQRHFLSRIADHRFGGTFPGIHHYGRVPSGVKPQRPWSIEQNPPARPMMRRQSPPLNALASRQRAGSEFQASPVRRFSNIAFARPQSAFLMARRVAPSARHGFSMGPPRGGSGRAAGRGSLSR